MARQNANVRSGNRVLVYVDGVAVGLAQSARLSDDYGPEGASGIGDIHMVEYVPTQARHNVSVQQMVLKKKSLRALRLIPENGDAVLAGLVFDIVIQDKDTGETLRKYISCNYASGDTEVNKHAIIVSSGVFNALDVQGAGL